jgi:hypothetical protein
MDAFDGSPPSFDLAPTFDDAPAGERSWTCRIVPKGARRHSLHLSGSLAAGWAGQLAAGLAARNISVVRATARRSSTRWTAEIAFDVLDGGVEPSAIDFIALMHEHASGSRPAEPVKLTSYRIVPTRRDVTVELRAEDAVGFLGRILRVFAEVGLFPHEMRVETLGGEVRDTFRLQRVSGEAPAEETVATLRARLARLA